MVMRILETMLIQDAVYWAYLRSDGTGTAVTSDPVQITCRWENTNELYKDATGKERVSQSIVDCSVDVTTQGYLYLGTLVSLKTITDALSVNNAFEIRKADKIPTLNGEQYLRTAWL